MPTQELTILQLCITDTNKILTDESGVPHDLSAVLAQVLRNQQAIMLHLHESKPIIYTGPKPLIYTGLS